MKKALREEDKETIHEFNLLEKDKKDLIAQLLKEINALYELKLLLNYLERFDEIMGPTSLDQEFSSI